MKLEINKKRQAIGGCRPLQPYAGAYPSHTADYCASLIISIFLSYRKGKLGKRWYDGESCLLYFCGAREKPCAAFLFISVSGAASGERRGFPAILCGCDRSQRDKVRRHKAHYYTYDVIVLPLSLQLCSLPHREPTETLKDFWKSLTLLTKGNETEDTVDTPGSPGQNPKERKKRR